QPAPVGTEAAESGHYPWLVSGVNQGMMQQWAAAFAASGVVLEHLYPLVGCAATSPELAPSEAGDVLLIEAHAGLVAGVRVSAGSVIAINLQQSTLKDTIDACLEAYHVLTPPEVKTIWLASAIGESDGLEISLTSMLGRPVNPLEIVKGDATPGMLGAARNALALAGAGRSCAVSVQGAKLPLWQSIEFRAIAAGLLLVIAVGAAEAVLQLRQNLAQAEAERVGKAAAVMDETVGKVQVRIDEIKKLKDELKAKNETLDKLQKRIDLLAIDVPKRTALVQSLLADLSSTVPEDMVIDRIEETPKDGFRVSAWSLTEKSAQQFVKAFQSAMESLGFKVMDVTVSSQTGRLSLQGYALRFRLVNQQDLVAAPTPAKK
ncbi:MAG: hypothetical protein HOP26_02365, partial [Methylotenera sp.]|nr:hypothetical protein [Methylotenera sp.]